MFSKSRFSKILVSEANCRSLKKWGEGRFTHSAINPVFGGERKRRNKMVARGLDGSVDFPWQRTGACDGSLQETTETEDGEEKNDPDTSLRKSFLKARPHSQAASGVLYCSATRGRHFTTNQTSCWEDFIRVYIYPRQLKNCFSFCLLS